MKKIISAFLLIFLSLSIIGCSKEFEKKYTVNNDNVVGEYFIKAKGDKVKLLEYELTQNYVNYGVTREEVEEFLAENIAYSSKKLVLESEPIKYKIVINDETFTEKVKIDFTKVLVSRSDLVKLGILEDDKSIKPNEKWYLSFKSYEEVLKDIGAVEIK